MLKIIVTVALIASAGCHVNEPTWTLGIYGVAERQIDDTVEIHAEVGFGGQLREETAVTDLRFCALDGEGNVMEMETVDRLSTDQRTTNVTVNLTQPPAKLVLGYGAVETDQPFTLQGRNRTDDGRYLSFYQDGSRS